MGGSGATFTQTGTATPSVSVANAGYTDVAGNDGTGHTLTLSVDLAAPTLSITAADTNLSAAETTTITFTFSEAVAAFASSDVTVTGGTLSGFSSSGATFMQTGTATPSVS